MAKSGDRGYNPDEALNKDVEREYKDALRTSYGRVYTNPDDTGKDNQPDNEAVGTVDKKGSRE